MTSVARGQGSQNFGQNISAQRFFSTAASTSESDAEVDSDASDDEASQQSGGKFQQFNTSNRNNSVMQQDIDLRQVDEKIQSGELDEMNEFQFMVYFQKLFRSFTNQRDVSAKERYGAIDKINAYLLDRLKREPEPIYLHQIGDHLSSSANNSRLTALSLRNAYNAAVIQGFGKSAEEMRPEYRSMSLYRFVQTLQPIGANSYRIKHLVEFASELLQNEDEPKPVIALYRLLHKFTQQPGNVRRWSKAIVDVLKVLDDENQVDMRSVNVRLRIQLLINMGDIMTHSQSGSSCYNMASQNAERLLQGILAEIEQLEERPVLDLINACNKMTALQPSGRISRLSSEILKRLTSIVTDMACDNPELVDINFSLCYLSRVLKMRYNLIDQGELEKFLSIVRSKGGDVETHHYIEDKLVSMDMLLLVRDQFSMKEFDDSILRKWTQGKRCTHRNGELFNTCKEIIEAKRRSGQWSEKDQASFEEQSLNRVELMLKPTYHNMRQYGYGLALQQMAILEQLPASERREEVMQKYREYLEMNKLKPHMLIRKNFLHSLIDLLIDQRVTIGEGETREVINKIVDESLETMKDGFSVSSELLNTVQKMMSTPGGDQKLKLKLMKGVQSIVDTPLSNNEVAALIDLVKATYQELLSNNEERVAFSYMNATLDWLQRSVKWSKADTYLARSVSDFLCKIAEMQYSPSNSQVRNEFMAKSRKIFEKLPSHKFEDYKQQTFNELLRKYKRTAGLYGRSFHYITNEINQSLGSDTIAESHKSAYLRLVDGYGERKITQKAKGVLIDFLQSNYAELAELARSNEPALQLVTHAKFNALYERVSRENSFNCNLSEEELGDSFKQAMISLQSATRRGIYKTDDQIQVLLELGRTNPKIVLEHKDLIIETLDVIYDKCIPKRQLIPALQEAFQGRKTMACSGQSRLMGNQILLHASNHFVPKLEEAAVDITPRQIVDLLEVFVSEGWMSHTTYNGFIRGFGTQFEKIPANAALDFIKNLVQAGLNQTDILDAVIQKCNNQIKDMRRPTIEMRRIRMNSILQTALDADATFETCPALETYLTENEDDLKLVFTKSSNSDKINLLAAIIARTDLTKESRFKQIGARIVASLNESLSKDSAQYQPSIQDRKKLGTVYYMLNEHPNRDRICGEDPAWRLEVGEALLDSMKRSSGGQKRSLRSLAKPMQQLGYSDAEEGSNQAVLDLVNYSYSPSTKTFVVAHRSPMMFDEKTAVTDVALVQKCVQALDEKIILADLNRLQVSHNLDKAVSYLLNLGVQDLRVSKQEPEQELEQEPEQEPEQESEQEPEQVQQDQEVTQEDDAQEGEEKEQQQ